MSKERQLPRRLLRWSAATVAVVAVLGGCSGGHSSTAADGKQDQKSSSASAHPPAGRPAQPAAAISQDRLQDALLTGFQRLSPITAPQIGPYSTLPAAQVASGAQETPAGATIKPAKCKATLWAGPDTTQFGKATAAVVAYRRPGDTSAGGVQAWEELVASTGQSREAALGTGPKSGCGTVKVSSGGNSLGFAEQRTASLGAGSRGAALTPTSPASRRTSVVTFIGKGYVGVVFMQGPVTKTQLDDFAAAAYKNAAEKLG
jgi:hypothetical protein